MVLRRHSVVTPFRDGTSSKILTSVCTCCFTAETVVKYDSVSEMFPVRTIANFWKNINQVSRIFPEKFPEHLEEGFNLLRLNLCLSCSLGILYLLYSYKYLTFLDNTKSFVLWLGDTNYLTYQRSCRPLFGICVQGHTNRHTHNSLACSGPLSTSRQSKAISDVLLHKVTCLGLLFLSVLPILHVNAPTHYCSVWAPAA